MYHAPSVESVKTVLFTVEVLVRNWNVPFVWVAPQEYETLPTAFDTVVVAVTVSEELPVRGDTDSPTPKEGDHPVTVTGTEAVA